MEKKPAQGRTRAATRSMTEDSKEENYPECGLERNGDKGEGDKIIINGLENTATTKDDKVERVGTDESQGISENHLVIRDVDSNTVVEEDSPDIIMNDTSPKVEVEKNYLIKVANGLVQADRKVKSLEKELDDAKKKIASQYSDLVKQQDKIALLSDEVKRLEGKEEIKALIEEVNGNKQRICLLEEEKSVLKSLNRVLEVENSELVNKNLENTGSKQQLASNSPSNTTKGCPQNENKNFEASDWDSEVIIEGCNKTVASNPPAASNPPSHTTKECPQSENKDFEAPDWDSEGIIAVTSSKDEGTLSTPKCWFGAKCKKSHCTFKHPEKASEKSKTHHDKLIKEPRRCKFGHECRRTNCMFQHTSVEQTETQYKSTMCWFGGKCRRTYCKFQHPSENGQPWNKETSVGQIEAQYKSNNKCRFGEKCTRTYCKFQHPRENRQPWSKEEKHDRIFPGKRVQRTPQYNNKNDAQERILDVVRNYEQKQNNSYPLNVETNVPFLGEAVSQITNLLEALKANLGTLQN